jgi:hypothetical protein
MLCCFKHPLRGFVGASGKELGIVSQHTTIVAWLVLDDLSSSTLVARLSTSLRFVAGVFHTASHDSILK